MSVRSDLRVQACLRRTGSTGAPRTFAAVIEDRTPPQPHLNPAFSSLAIRLRWQCRHLLLEQPLCALPHGRSMAVSELQETREERRAERLARFPR